jgi:hypothetical protein
LLVLDSYADNFKPPTLPLALSEIFNAAFYQKPYTDVIQECERLVKIESFFVSQIQSDDVARSPSDSIRHHCGTVIVPG